MVVLRGRGELFCGLGTKDAIVLQNLPRQEEIALEVSLTGLYPPCNPLIHLLCGIHTAKDIRYYLRNA